MRPFDLTEPNGPTFRDSFPGGRPQLRWSFYPYFNLDNLEGARDEDAPDGDGGIGVLRNANMGGFASLSYAVTDEVEDFYLEAMIYCPVTEEGRGPLSGIAFLIDPIKGGFYRFVCDLTPPDQTLNIAYVGRETRNYPVYLRFWGPGEVPGGAPRGGWHRMAVEVKGGKARAYWDGSELEGEILVDRIPRGFAGVYANYIGGFGNATTRVDDFALVVIRRTGSDRPGDQSL